MKTSTQIRHLVIATIIGAILGLAVGIFSNQKWSNLVLFALIGALINGISTSIKLAVLSFWGGMNNGEDFVEEEDEVTQAERGLTPDEDALYGDTGREVPPNAKE